MLASQSGSRLPMASLTLCRQGPCSGGANSRCLRQGLQCARHPSRHCLRCRHEGLKHCPATRQAQSPQQAAAPRCRAAGATKPRVAGSKRCAEGSSDADPAFAAQAASALGRGSGDSDRQNGGRRLDPSVLPLPDDEAGAAATRPGFDRETAALKVGCCSCMVTHA